MKCKECRFFKRLDFQGTMTWCCCKDFMEPDGVIVQMNKPEGCPEDDLSKADIIDF